MKANSVCQPGWAQGQSAEWDPAIGQVWGRALPTRAQPEQVAPLLLLVDMDVGGLPGDEVGLLGLPDPMKHGVWEQILSVSFCLTKFEE